MRHLLDTSVLIDVLRGDEEAVGFLAGLAEVPCCSEVTRTEVLRGVHSGERRAVARLFESLDWIVVDERTSQTAGELGRAWRQSHPGIDTADLLVAASAELAGAVLATANVRHFPMFEGLQPPY
ncbi:MAG: type II toxin-antitoxin system VapC family toxin [Thermoleophilia bacterium]|nr:type II toxin-antitoxin system VapC family toxin [Thermoleophilia bacterium]